MNEKELRELDKYFDEIDQAFQERRKAKQLEEKKKQEALLKEKQRQAQIKKNNTDFRNGMLLGMFTTMLIFTAVFAIKHYWNLIDSNAEACDVAMGRTCAIYEIERYIRG